MRFQGMASNRLTLGTISTPPGTGSPLVQSVVKPRWASTTSNEVALTSSLVMPLLILLPWRHRLARHASCGASSYISYRRITDTQEPAMDLSVALGPLKLR